MSLEQRIKKAYKTQKVYEMKNPLLVMNSMSVVMYNIAMRKYKLDMEPKSKIGIEHLYLNVATNGSLENGSFRIIDTSCQYLDNKNNIVTYTLNN